MTTIFTFYVTISSALVSGLAMMSRLARNRLHQSDYGFENSSIDFDQIDM
jgi:hypothetical protein